MSAILKRLGWNQVVEKNSIVDYNYRLHLSPQSGVGQSTFWSNNKNIKKKNSENFSTFHYKVGRIFFLEHLITILTSEIERSRKNTQGYVVGIKLFNRFPFENDTWKWKKNRVLLSVNGLNDKSLRNI